MSSVLRALAGFTLPQSFQTTISWQGVEDRDTTPTYTRRGVTFRCDSVTS